MHQKRMLVSITFVFILITILGFSTKKAAASEGLTIDYLVSYQGGENSAPGVTIVISNLNTSQIDLILSPMSITEDQNLWLVDSEQITATGEGGKKVRVTDGGLTTVPYLGSAAQYRLLHFTTTGLSTVTIQYALNQPVMLGYLETFLLRPRDHNLVGNASLKFELPKDWLAAHKMHHFEVDSYLNNYIQSCILSFNKLYTILYARLYTIIKGWIYGN